MEVLRNYEDEVYPACAGVILALVVQYLDTNGISRMRGSDSMIDGKDELTQ